MKNKLWVLIFMLVFIFNGCKHRDSISNRIYFTFHPEDRKVIVPVQLNDSVDMNLVFDTGMGNGYTKLLITMDSTILITRPNLFVGIESMKLGLSCGWNPTYIQGALVYEGNQILKIGNIDFNYAYIQVANWKKFMNNDFSDGVFNIPKSDTTHVWELNFEHNYMEIHSANDFTIPTNSYITPLIEFQDYPFYVDLPLQIEFKNHDTLTLNKRFLIDTGAAWDIILYNVHDTEFLSNKDNAVWLEYLNGYIRYNTVNATIGDGFEMDSVRIYTFNNQIDVEYLMLGLNFLKRFNVFFDMKNRQLGLQPIQNFERLVNPLFRRFHYSTLKTRNGKYIVNKLGDYEGNYYKAVGLRMKDEIVAINGIPYGEITREIRDSLKKQDTLTLEIIRSGKPLTLSVPIDPNEPKGD